MDEEPTESLIEQIRREHMENLAIIEKMRGPSTLWKRNERREFDDEDSD